MLSYTKLVAFALLFTKWISCAANADNLRRSKRSIVLTQDALQPSLHVRICNAFTDKAPVGVLLKNDEGKEVDLTKKEALQYKSCKALALNLQRGDTLQFEQGGSQLGAFAVTTVPQWDAILLLIVHRKGTSSQAAFASHVFSRTNSAQVAVLDMYNGPSMHSIAIQEKNKLAVEAHGRHLSVLSESLAYETVVAVNHGSYFCVLSGSTHKGAAVPFKAVDGESYLAMRVGSSINPDFPEELVVFPSSGACRTGLLSLTILTGMLIWL